MSKIYFVGGIFEPEDYTFYMDNSVGVIQNAANVYQCNIIKGLDQVFTEGVKVVSLPFIGSYPSRFKKIFIKSKKSKIFDGSVVVRLGFLNFSIVKIASRFFSLLSFLVKEKLKSGSSVVIYSMHLPFIAATVLARFVSRRKYSIYIVVPDLPEYMCDRSDITYRFFKKIDFFLLSFFRRYADGYILLTKHMASKLNINDDQYIVVEGVANLQDYEKSLHVNKEKYIFYSGTLAERYGIKELVDAFIELKPKHYQLWICGDGDSLSYIEKKSITENGIKYLGQLPREEVIELQKNAAVLVNPRRPEGEFTKYSFPSKVMEYMTSGRPVLMHKLPGIPSEYFQYCYTPASSSFSSFVDCLNNTLALPSSDLTSKGLAAKNFINKNKTYVNQAEKIKDFLLRNS